jgi:transposase-like protein
MTGPKEKAENERQPPHEEDALDQALLRYPLAERMSWRAEALRLGGIVSEYARIKPKRRRDPKTGKYEFTPEVRRLCEQARCSDAVILTREPHRARGVSPHTLDNWLREWRRGGLTAFLRQPHNSPDPQQDHRYASMSAAAVDYINENWRRFRSPRAFYRALCEEGDKQGWTLPGESWLYRRWQEMPEVVRVSVMEGKAAYESRCAPYVPRNYEDLEALQIVCGDHSERDVTVLVDGKDLARPWLTVWQDLL